MLKSIPLAFGALGQRKNHLAGLILATLGRRGEARQAFRKAALAPQPFWVLALISLYQAPVVQRSSAFRLRWAQALLRWAPELACLRWDLAQEILADHLREDPHRAWALLVEAVPLAAEDPLLLEDLLILGLLRIQIMNGPLPSLGVQELHPELPYIIEESLDLLTRRHGDPRIPWDRTLPAQYLVSKGRHLEAVALALSVPPAKRSMALAELLITAQRTLKEGPALGPLLQDALEYHPGSFKLWMAQFQEFMERQRPVEGLEALNQAQRLLPIHPSPGQEILGSEWLVQRASYAHWIEKDSSRAWEYLEAVPSAGRPSTGPSSRIPLLRVQVLSALGRYEEAHEALRLLVSQHPLNVDLQLLQAEVMAGLEAWEALLPYLEQVAEALRSRPEYWHLRGLCHTHLGEPMKAREILERAAYMAQSNLRFILDAGHACMDLSEFERAEQHWRQALKLDEKYEETLIQLAKTRRSLHDEEGAKRLLRECLLHHPECEEAQVFLGEMEAN